MDEADFNHRLNTLRTVVNNRSPGRLHRSVRCSLFTAGEPGDVWPGLNGERGVFCEPGAAKSRFKSAKQPQHYHRNCNSIIYHTC